MAILYAYAHLAWFSTLLITVGVTSSASKNYGVSAFRVTRTLRVLLRNVPCMYTSGKIAASGHDDYHDARAGSII
jgi:hypothetical protein